MQVPMGTCTFWRFALFTLLLKRCDLAHRSTVGRSMPKRLKRRHETPHTHDSETPMSDTPCDAFPDLPASILCSLSIFFNARETSFCPHHTILRAGHDSSPSISLSSSLSHSHTLPSLCRHLRAKLIFARICFASENSQKKW